MRLHLDRNDQKERTVKRFLIFPKRIRNEIRWFELTEVRQVNIKENGYWSWYDVEFMNK